MAHHLNWQKSSYSEEASSCVYLASTLSGEVLLRESDTPDVILATTPVRLRPFLARIKTGTFSAR
ncbi:DUF397 domain-containing protein [Streptomyces sp. NPDC008001]|uniref:DUF397 domain-containing protein n=1 Tax=Streptomyces sp. NPDC008001 TaxID=3364804 RepID=UPI0036E08357